MTTLPPSGQHPGRLLITAGPTHEPIDAVRYIANRSTGRMGIALAEEAARRDIPTTLLLGPTGLEPRGCSQVTCIRFRTVGDLQALLARHWPDHDVLIMAAAVADYRPVAASGATGGAKLPRGKEPVHLRLEPTPDLLAELSGTTRPDQTVIGFALEPEERLLDSARRKLTRKRLDAIVANPLRTMESTTITATLLLASGDALRADPDLPKADFAAWLLDRVGEMRR